jgi:chromosome segregation ATPase
MNVESKNALTANAKLKEELALQSVGVENLLQRYKKQEEQFLKLKIEKSMLAKTSHLQLNQIASLKRQHYEYEARVSDMQYSMRRMNAERLSKEEELEEVPKLLDEIEQYKSLYEKSAGEVETWKAKAAQGSTAHSDFEKRAKAMEYLHKRMQLSGSMEFLPSSDPLAASFDASSFVPAAATTPVEVDVSHMWSSKFPANPAKSVLRKSKSANAKLKPIHPSASAPRLHASEDRFNFF